MTFDHIPAIYNKDAKEPNGINMIVETPRGTGNKFAWKEEYGIIELRRILRSDMKWPCDFGFVPQTLADDGDALDVALLIDEPCFPACLVRARVLGVIGLVKNGEQNDRILACPISLPGAASRWDEIRELGDLGARIPHEIAGFLRDYGAFEGNDISLTGLGNAQSAMQSVRESHERWKEENAKLKMQN